jgi:hypothetical protein
MFRVKLIFSPKNEAMKKVLFMIPICLLGLFACEKTEMGSSETQKLESEAVATLFAQRMVAFQEEISNRNAAVQWQRIEQQKQQNPLPTIAQAESLIQYLKQTGVQFDTKLVYELGESLDQTLQLQQKGQLDQENFSRQFEKALSQTSIAKDYPQIQERALYDPGCRMCCLREHDDRRDDISRDLIRCMTLGGGLYEQTIGWMCVAESVMDIVESNIEMQKCINEIEN